MILGRVVGTLWATRKDPGLVGLKLLIIRQIGLDLGPKDAFVIAADAVGAGTGEVVLVATGSSARQTEITKGKPVDAVVMAIIDQLDVPTEPPPAERSKSAQPGSGSTAPESRTEPAAAPRAADRGPAPVRG